jgi:hypothetical protein
MEEVKEDVGNVIHIPIKMKYYCKAILNILNFGTRMTDVELDVINTMLTNNIITLTKETRVQLSSLLNKDVASVNFHIMKIKNKGVLVNNWHGKLTIAPKIVNAVKEAMKEGELIFKLCPQ